MTDLCLPGSPNQVKVGLIVGMLAPCSDANARWGPSPPIPTLNGGMARLSLRHVGSHAFPAIGMRHAFDAMACEVGLSALVERRLGDDRRRLPGPHRLAAVDAAGDRRLVLDAAKSTPAL
jgi:hypothetical protein